MGETQENWILHQNSQSPHLKYHLQLKTREDVGGNGNGTSKGRKAIYLEMEKQMFGKQYLLGQAETMGHKVDSDF